MRKRKWGIGIVAALAAAAACTPAAAATVNVSAKAKVVKPLALSAIQGLDLGTIILAPGSWSGSTVSISKAGVFSCAANLTCSGATQPAQFRVSGSNNMTVVVTAPNVTLVNQNNGSQTLTMKLDSPATVQITNSSPNGTVFSIGGSITLDSTTGDGTYSGTIQVTADYQ